MNKPPFFAKVTRMMALLVLLTAALAGSGGAGAPAAQAAPAEQAAAAVQAASAEQAAGQAGGQAQEGTTGTYKFYLPRIFWAGPPEWMGPDGGSVVCLKASKSNPSVIYAGTLYSGIYRSANRGATWEWASKGLDELFIDSVEVDPTNADIAYAGTHGKGVYKTTNGGASWFPVNNGIAADSVVYTVVANPGNPELVFAGTRIQNTTFHGVTYKTTNGGESWSKIMDYSDDWVYSLAVNPSEPNVMLAAVHTGGARYSDNYGSRSSWVDATGPQFNDPYLAERWTKGRAVAFDPRGWRNRAYYTSWHDGMLSYSTNKGKSWSMTPANLDDTHVYPNGISVSPSSPDIVYLAAHSSSIAGVLRSDDAGMSWEGAGLTGKTIYSVAALAGGSDTLLAGTYMDGLFKSDDGGATWYYSMSGIHDSNVTGMVFAGGNTVYASAKTGGGVFRSQDGGKTWAVFVRGLGDLSINGLVLHPSNPNILYALTNHAGLRRIDLSSGGGWEPAGVLPVEEAAPVEETDGLFAAPLPPDDALAIDGEQPMLPSPYDPSSNNELNADMATIGAPALSMTFAPSNSQIAYVGTNGSGVYLSTNSGTSWNPAGLSGKAIRGLAVRPDNDTVVYAATNQAGVIQVSTNRGASWQAVTLPDAKLAVYAVAAVPGDPSAVYVGTSSGVYRYGGGAWKQVGLVGYQVQVLAHHRSLPDLLFAGTTAGAFRTAPGASAWVSVSDWVDGMPISSINFNPDDPLHVYVGTGTRGTLKAFLQ